ncbi:MAG: 4-alpha-glucanotransferase [Bryobacteraceae bacterium]|nr:4-alpha-glucanotransferase [Bryobacteraceae bacterium]
MNLHSTQEVTFQASPDYESAVERAAEEFGLEPEYIDVMGERQRASLQVKRALLQAMGVPADTAETLDEAVEARLWEQWSRPAPATLVVRALDGPTALRLPAAALSNAVELTIAFEEGGRWDAVFAPAAAQPMEKALLRGVHFTSFAMPLPDPLPLGYHDLTVRIGPAEYEAKLIAAPASAWLPGGKPPRSGGIAISLFGLRSERNWGSGDFTDLIRFCRWASRETGSSFVALNPLHAIANRQPYNTSPYLPQSAFYRNDLYLDLEAIPEFAASEWAQRWLSSGRVQAEIQELRNSGFVEYERVARLKNTGLRIAFREFLRHSRQGSRRSAAFQQYVEQEGDLLHRFAMFRALDEVLHRADPDLWLWTKWPEPYRHPDSPATIRFGEAHWRRILFHKWVQWLVDSQLAEAQQAAVACGMPLGLYHDLALATDRFGADLWAHRDAFVERARVGAPPDDFSPEGQDWSFPPPDHRYLQASGYRLFIETIRKNIRHGGALRMDHVMRFFRLYWIPEGLPAKQGAYVRDRARDLLGILALESVRAQSLLVGEDLGTVTEEMRADLYRYGILSYRVLYFERDGEGRYRAPWEYPEQALVCSTTHDLPTIAGFWTGRDIEARREAELITGEAYQAMLDSRAAEKQNLLATLRGLNLLPDWYPADAAAIPEFTGELHNAVMGFLAMTGSALLLVNQEDLTKETEQQNLPGSTHQYPNWRRKMKYTLEELETSPRIHDFCAMFRGWLERSGRLRA